MLHLRTCILARILSSPATSTISPLRRLLSVAAPAISPSSGFATEEYLVDTCGLTRPQALKVAAKLSNVKPPSNSNPAAVRSFLAGLGLSTADVAAVVARDPELLCADADRTLAPIVLELTALGLQRSEIARLALLAGRNFRCESLVSKLLYYLPLFGSMESILRAFNNSNYLLSSDIERVVKPNVDALRECGLSACDIGKLSISSRLLTARAGHVRAAVTCAEGLGVPRESRMFRQMLRAVAFLSEEKIAVKVGYLKKTFRWSDAEVSIAVTKAPMLLRKSDELLQRTYDFLSSEVGVEPTYIAYRPVMINYSLEGRLTPRYYVLKFLKENGLLDRYPDYYAAVTKADKVFLKKYIHPYNETAPHLAQDYADACRGQVPARFIFA